MEEAKDSPDPDIAQPQIPQNAATSLINEENQQHYMNYSAQQQPNSAELLHSAQQLDQANMTQNKSGLTPDLENISLNALNERD